MCNGLCSVIDLIHRLHSQLNVMPSRVGVTRVTNFIIHLSTWREVHSSTCQGTLDCCSIKLVSTARESMLDPRALLTSTQSSNSQRELWNHFVPRAFESSSIDILQRCPYSTTSRHTRSTTAGAWSKPAALVSPASPALGTAVSGCLWREF